MVPGATGRRGVHVPTVVEKARKQELERVQIQLQSMEAKTVQEIPRRLVLVLGVQVNDALRVNSKGNTKHLMHDFHRLKKPREKPLHILR